MNCYNLWPNITNQTVNCWLKYPQNPKIPTKQVKATESS